MPDENFAQMEAVKEYFIEFLRYPTTRLRREAKDPMIPSTRVEFAKLHQVSRQTLWRWEHDPEFIRLVHDDHLMILSEKEIEKILWGLKVKAFEGNAPQAKLLFEWAGLAGEHRTPALGPDEVTVKKEISELTDAELEKLIEEEDETEDIE